MTNKKTLQPVLAIVFSIAVLLITGCTLSSWQFAVTGDSRGSDNGVNTAILGEIANDIAKKKVDFVLFTGDLVSGAANQQQLESQFNTWKKTMYPVYHKGIDVYPVRGNHDAGSIEAWDKDFGYLPDNGPNEEKNLTYSVIHKNALIIGLDEYVKRSRINQAWLDSRLAVDTKPHLFIFGHEPAFRVGHEDCLDNYPAARNRFIGGIEKAGGRIYFTGHDHFYDHLKADNDGNPDNDIHQYILGTAGAPLYEFDGTKKGNNSNYKITRLAHVKKNGYILGRIDGPKVTLTWMERISKGKFKAKGTWSYTAKSKHFN